MTKVQLEELREVIHPAGKLESRAEHWAGRLYMRSLSLRVTRQMLGTRVSPNQITTVMVFAGVLSGVALVVPGLGGAVLSVLFMQLYLLLDCVDGEVARWRRQFSPLGVYLDRLGAYLADAAVMVGMGIRAAQLGLNLYLVAGLAAAIGVLLLKSSSDLVHVARSDSGMEKATDQSVVPRSSGLARVRRLTSAVGLHRLVNGIECTILLLVTAIVDLALGDLTATKIVTVAVTAIVWLLVPAHIVSIVASSRLK
ncbi:CDP-alcohol phosphatidyltransferase family protein [Streptomyces sp. RLB1-33]|uniref:CDP-alcohol phosphatidyltransferase family protein n=1 Tax=Streptomyces mirabilis TaxID=68239 RepID=UPI00143E4126|nr:MULTISPECIES: CDP-alcohol phosphatidyltransferase family protein [Streptomyces]QIY71943.1 CDP-alcohol phosphatidyltransferase family protein [Streptomyces sp. RLB1-33]QUW81078.1 CDP-alcohol phosphatidyltransferase family protein [Streptomyces mirabilis]